MESLLFSVFFLGSFLITYFTIPKIIKLVFHKNLLDVPNDRSSHKRVTPTLGGVSFFISIVLLLVFLKQWDIDKLSLNLIVSLTVLFMVGLKDDLLALSAKVKALAQLIAISFLIFDNEFLHIDSFYGFLGLEQVNYWFFVLFTYFSMFFIINSFNLIDGIDGLASSIGILIFSIYGVIFYFLNNYYYTFICVILIGALAAFLNYNLSEKKKIFMGDTGSMIVGFVIAMLSFKLFGLNTYAPTINIASGNLPVLLLSIITIPLLDTIRVFVVRTLNGKSFFIADRNHIHHIFIDIGLSHKKATLVITSINFLFILVIYLLSNVLSSGLLLITYLSLSIVFYMILYYIRGVKKIKKQAKTKVKIINKLDSFITNFFF